MDNSSSNKRDNWLAATTILSAIALILAMVGIGMGARALASSDESDGGGSTESLTKSVTLADFSISPSTITIGEGGSLSITNTGAVAHNLVIEGSDVRSSDIQPGESTVVDFSALEKGNYTAFCDIPGHRSAGMEAKLKVVSSSGSSGTNEMNMSGSSGHQMSPAEMDKVMRKTTDEYVKAVTSGTQLTKGVGAQFLEPKVLEDGTKQFDLTAAITDWEVSPGKIVKAWTYNGTVPGPTLKVGVGDKVKVVLTNKLPEPTVIHWHGVQDLPNAVDGVPFVTQPSIQPNETYAYEFTTPTQSVGMYHSHYDAQKQVVNGLLGAFLVGDVPLPKGVTRSQEVPMVLNDSGAIGYSLNGKSFPATAPIVAKLGDYVEIHWMNEGLMAHPMHTHGFPMQVIAKDGIKLDSPYYADTINVSPGERYTTLVHVTHPGVWALHCHILTHAEGDDGMFGMVTAIIVQ